MKVVVTGGAGYIGSVACHQLAALGAQLRVYDNLSQGHAASLPESVELVRGDIVDQESLSALLRAFRPDAVLHFAALTIAPESVRDPAPYWRVNAGGTIAVLNAMRQAEVGRLVLSSTAAVYGTPTVTPVPEHAALAPINPYGASKLAAEHAVASYAAAYGLTYAALRYFNVAGAIKEAGEDHRPETHLIPSVIDVALGRRDPLSIFGTDFPTHDGTAVRDYVHVEDLVEAHVLALDRLLHGAESLGPINLGTRDGASVREVISAVERVTGASVAVTYTERRPGDPAVLIADATRAREILGWRPHRSSLEEMVASAWEWRQRFPKGYANGVARS